MKEENKQLLLSIFAGIPLLIWSAFVIKKLWLWFIVPLGLMEISVSHAIGIDLIASFILMTSTTKGDKITLEMIINRIIKPSLYLLIGFIVFKLFM